ncbi:hypothetical protein [Prevotella amnii]|uniref:Uncharacterized protein n=1 Tax=Prevotella amnii DNF00058 TaxID=1401066 RepID=A0A096D4P0_9BACT|nr:hypothetical protein [Prevotella amnii]KGF52499.1 hypothetical protein HMPREF9302_03475 [Prevotella amnii DNF00058]
MKEIIIEGGKASKERLRSMNVGDVLRQTKLSPFKVDSIRSVVCYVAKENKWKFKTKSNYNKDEIIVKRIQ